jgi:UDP-N-acetylglucosamine diphosphorylase / glucose-1-phosphate thymidylyltransferase / UDP-N-acetylgalactosamine diphosphorylase / glucosamine-1-phosphate N-acetyltransferase / galactosamine-1-phosphate N-acetyltransferase
MSILVYEDQWCESLAPMTTGRLAATITCGSYRLLDLVKALGQDTYGISRRYLEPIQAIDYPELKVLHKTHFDSANSEEPVRLILNARIAPTESNRTAIQRLLNGSPEPAVVRDREIIAAIVNPPVTLADIAKHDQSELHQQFSVIADSLRPFDVEIAMFAAPHEVIATNMRCLASNLERRISETSYQQLEDGVFVGEGASLGQYVICETQNGPIIIEDGAKVGPYSLLRGPIYIGKKCKILEHSAIKDHVSLGHTTKIGGEVEASVVEPYSNKQHHGFLGHSYLGSWINLGAGTCNSDLKNTYGQVNMEYPMGKATTGMQFLGCIMGDYSKTAINTGIFTGKVIGVCSMMYGFVTSNVPSFVNYARLFGQVATLPADVMVATQQRMFARRQVAQRTCDIDLIHDMYRMTQFERDQSRDITG